MKPGQPKKEQGDKQGLGGSAQVLLGTFVPRSQLGTPVGSGAPVHSDVWLHGYRLQKELVFVPSHDYLVAFHLLWSPVPFKDDLQLLMLLPPPSEC